MLSWETEGDIIKRLRLAQETVTSSVRYSTYVDPDTQQEYYSRYGNVFTSDPYDIKAKLDSAQPADKEIIDRLQKTNKELQVTFLWKVYEDANGKEYYSYNDGTTFVPRYVFPDSDVIDSNNPDDQNIIAGLKPRMGAVEGSNRAEITYTVFVDKTSSETYYSSDNGKTFVVNMKDPLGTGLDPVRDKAIIERLEPKQDSKSVGVEYDRYLAPNGRVYYTKDGGQTFIDNLYRVDNIVLNVNNPADASAIASLVPDFKKADGLTNCEVYEDSAGKQYYTKDHGKTWFDDLSDPTGSAFSATDPAYTGIIAGLSKVDTTVTLISVYDTYKNPANNALYYSSDGGISFSSQPNPLYTLPSTPQNEALIKSLVPVCNTSSVSVTVNAYIDPVTGVRYFDHPEGGNRYIDVYNKLALDPANPDQLSIINRLQEGQERTSVTVYFPLPEVIDVYEDPKTGGVYYSIDHGETFTKRPTSPYYDYYYLDPVKNKEIIDNLQPKMGYAKKLRYVWQAEESGAAGGGAAISTQELAQKALAALDRAIISKDKIRAHLGALQNRLENTISNLSIKGENLQAAESRISDTDVATEMTQFVRNQVLTQSAVAMLGQANSYPHMLFSLLGGA